jgi:hypothetical protein
MLLSINLKVIGLPLTSQKGKKALLGIRHLATQHGILANKLGCSDGALEDMCDYALEDLDGGDLNINELLTQVVCVIHSIY